MKPYKFKFDTAYHQFYIEDASDSNKGNAASPSFWSEKAINERLALTNGIVGVGTESYGCINGELELLEKKNDNVDSSKYDHVVEGGIDIQSGELHVLDCPNAAIQFTLKVNPGKYRVRIYSSNLASVQDFDLPNDTDSDYYRIELWRSEEMDRKVLVQYRK